MVKVGILKNNYKVPDREDFVSSTIKDSLFSKTEYIALNKFPEISELEKDKEEFYKIDVFKKTEDVSTQTDDLPKTKETSTQTEISYLQIRMKKKEFSKKKITFIKKIKTIISIASSILSIYKSTFCQPFKIIEDLYSTYVSIYDFTNTDFRSIKSISENLYKVIKAIASLACSILIYPLRIFISKVKDIIKSIEATIDIIKHMIKSRNINELKKIFFCILKIFKDLCFVFSLIFAYKEFVLIYFGLSFTINSYKAFKELKKGNYLESMDFALSGASNIMSTDEKMSEIFNKNVVDDKVA